MARPRLLPLVLFAALCLFNQLELAHAAMTSTGSVAPSDPMTWNSSTTGYVGYSADGSLWVDGGSDLFSDDAYVGYNSATNGYVTISDGGSSWTNGDDLHVGYNGNGTLDILGAALASSDCCIAWFATSTSQMTVSGPGSTWTNSASIKVGLYGYGALTVSDGGAVSSDTCTIGSWADSTGLVTVTGTGSSWTTTRWLTVGKYGSGTLAISDGASVAVNDITYVGSGDTGFGMPSTSAIVFGPGGGTLATQSLYAAPTQLTGTGTVNAHGLLTDLDFVFDTAASSTQTFHFNTEPGQDVTVNLDMSDPGDVGVLGAGYYGSGSITIRDGTTVRSRTGCLAYQTGSVGTATVTGADSTWNLEFGLSVGGYGTGTLAIIGGGSISNSYSWIGKGRYSTGEAIVSGASSSWIHSSYFDIGSSGNGTLTVREGGAISDTAGRIGYYATATGTATVAGSGSTWTNSTSLLVGDKGNGKLGIADGGSVSAPSVSINSQSLLAIEVNDGSLLNIAGGSGTIANDGTVRIIAGAVPAPGAVCTPILAGTCGGAGTYHALGGTWNAVSHEFTTSPVIQTASGIPLGFDLATIQRVRGADTATGWTVGVSFLTPEGSAMLNFTATAAGGEVLADLQDRMDPGETVLGAWEFAATGGYTPGDPAYLSFDVGPGQSWDDLEIWHYDGADWTQFDAWDLTYDGTYASFTVTDFSGYAVTPVKNVWIPGDCDGDNRVDADDAQTLAAHWGQPGEWANGDFDDDGIVGPRDAAILAANWGYVAPTESGNSSGSVPEPGVIVLLLGLGAAMLLGRNGRR
ncbi:MAG: hypothetical protein JW888_00860 [Pirellulales bacterium]|nr:hypothetical protein [Pirellulales bacterium]